MDWFQVVTGQPSPLERRRGERQPEPEVIPGADIGAIAGRAVRQERQRREGGHREPSTSPSPGSIVIGPGGVVGDDRAAQAAINDPRETQRRSMHALWGQEAAALARRADRRPRLGAGPDEALDFPIGPGGVVGDTPATSRAAVAVGVPRQYLDTLIVQESGGNPNARAPTSSATGHAQFIDSTWLRMMRQYGGRYGFGEGRLADLSDDDVLELRTDPEWAAIMAAEYSRENAELLKPAIGREPTQGEVYLAHFLGPGDAARLINAAQEDRRRERGGRPATQFVSPGSAEANRTIFYDENGRSRSAGVVAALQMRKFSPDLFRLQDRQD